jgi:hypothetical protein
MTYSPLIGEDVYSVAAKLYNDVYLGVMDLLILNQSINLNLSDLSGLNLNYTSGLKRKKPNFAPLQINASGSVDYIVRESQSIYDLAIQIYGDVQKLPDLISAFTNINLQIAAGSKYTYLNVNNPIKQYFLDRGIIISTFKDQETIISKGLITDDGFFIITDDGQNIIT